MFAATIGRPLDLTRASESTLWRLVNQDGPHRIAARAEIKRRRKQTVLNYLASNPTASAKDVPHV